MRIRSIQPTPNPNAYKFVLEERILQQGVRQFETPAEAAKDPLANALFAIDGVRGVFFCDDFVTVTWGEGADWRRIQDQVQQILGRHEIGARAAEPVLAAVAGAAPASDDVELMQKINEVLDDRVRPALAGDGGGLEIVGLQGKTLRVRYQGACGSCPSSIAGTLMAIENMLQSEVDEELKVVTA
jgi:Fe-S cluster biogenesis protein NfuA